MRRWRRWAALLLVCLLAMGLAGCSSASRTPADEEETHQRRLLFVTDDIEEAFSAQAWQLLQTAAQKSGVQVTLLEVQGQADKASAALNQASEGLYDLVVLGRLSGETADDWVRRSAGYYPNVRYLCLDTAFSQPLEVENVTWLRWDDLAVYYLYGSLAALRSQSGTLAYFGAESGLRSERRFLAFYEGARRMNDQVRALYTTLGGAPSAQEAGAAVQNILQEDADVLCVQSADTAVLVQQLLGQQDPPPAALQENILAGGTLDNGETLAFSAPPLLGFVFDTQTILETVFADACADTLAAGGRVLSLQSDDLTLQPGPEDAGLDQEDAARLETVRREAADGVLDTLLQQLLDEEDIQARITAAAERKDLPPPEEET